MTALATEAVVDQQVHRGIGKWAVSGGIGLIFMLGMWTAMIDKRIEVLEQSSVKREEVVRLQGSMDLLRLEIQQLRSDIGALRERP